MPEGPELHLASLFVNQVSKGRIFCGQVVKSAVSTKNPDVPWCEKQYTIFAVSRGKEVKLTLETLAEQSKESKKKKSLDILFRFGMSGKFRFDKVSEMHKHAHLNFFTDDGDMVLSFVDYRRFGKWEISSKWGKDRGPCVLQEYQAFREKVLQHTGDPAFNRPICETLLNQKFFNGIGNYLRAEILYRAEVPPFQQAREVIEPLLEKSETPAIKSEKPDILQLCNILPTEVVNLSGGKGYDPEATSDDDYSAFANWLQCYYNPNMKNMVDSNKRTIWFHGKPGPMAPRDGKSRFRKTKTHLEKKAPGDDADQPSAKKAKVRKPTRAELARIKTEIDTANAENDSKACGRKTGSSMTRAKLKTEEHKSNSTVTKQSARKNRNNSNSAIAKRSAVREVSNTRKTNGLKTPRRKGVTQRIQKSGARKRSTSSAGSSTNRPVTRRSARLKQT